MGESVKQGLCLRRIIGYVQNSATSHWICDSLPQLQLLRCYLGVACSCNKKGPDFIHLNIALIMSIIYSKNIVACKCSGTADELLLLPKCVA